MPEVREVRAAGSRFGWAIASLVVALAHSWWLYSTATGSARILNAAQMRPIFLLGSVPWVIGLGMGVLGFRGSTPVVRPVAVVGIVANVAGLVATAITYAKWCEQPGRWLTV